MGKPNILKRSSLVIFTSAGVWIYDNTWISDHRVSFDIQEYFHTISVHNYMSVNPSMLCTVNLKVDTDYPSVINLHPKCQ